MGDCSGQTAKGGTSGVGDEYLALEVFEQLGAVSE